ncbi:hypothetical protein bcere0013_38400 [Bacillus cereus BDRD-ST26]|nr:hypothetical protein bcere0013_38400 [Bacillus cereus BDRD-ST26]
MVAIFLCFEPFKPFAGSIDVCMFLPPFFLGENSCPSY